MVGVLEWVIEVEEDGGCGCIGSRGMEVEIDVGCSNGGGGMVGDVKGGFGSGKWRDGGGEGGGCNGNNGSSGGFRMVVVMVLVVESYQQPLPII